MNPKMRLLVLLISNVSISFIGFYRLVTEPVSFVPCLFALCGLVGTIGTIFGMRRKEQM